MGKYGQDGCHTQAGFLNWPEVTFDILECAQHEIMMETPETRKRFYDRATALFDAQGG